MSDIRAYLLLGVRAFSGRRGRSGLVSFLLGEAGASTVTLAREQGIGALDGQLHGTAPADIHRALSDLQHRGFVAVKDTTMQDKVLPLLYLTEQGKLELERLRPLLNIPDSPTALTPEKALLVLTRLGKLMEDINSLSTTSLPERLGLSAGQYEYYIELLCKALGLKKEVALASPQAARQFAAKLAIALCAEVLCDLPEVEAQAIRLVAGIAVPHQLSAQDFNHYFPHISVTEKAKMGATRLLSREWQARGQLISVLGFLAMSERDQGGIFS